MRFPNDIIYVRGGCQITSYSNSEVTVRTDYGYGYGYRRIMELKLFSGQGTETWHV